MLLKRNHLAWLIGRPTPKMEESRKNRFGAHCSTLVTWSGILTQGAAICMLLYFDLRCSLSVTFCIDKSNLTQLMQFMQLNPAEASQDTIWKPSWTKV